MGRDAGVNSGERQCTGRGEEKATLFYFSPQVHLLSFDQIIFKLLLINNGTTKSYLLQFKLNVLRDNADCQI